MQFQPYFDPSPEVSGCHQKLKDFLALFLLFFIVADVEFAVHSKHVPASRGVFVDNDS